MQKMMIELEIIGMKRSIRRYLMFMILGILALASLYAEEKEYPGLDVFWSFDASKESFTVGFTEKKPAAELNQYWDRLAPATTVSMRDYIQNSSTFHKAYGKVYVYCNFFSNEDLSVYLGSTGPLTALDSKEISNDRNKINWTATWTPLGVNANGDIIEMVGSQMSIGRDDNDFMSSSEDYGAKLLFEQKADDYPLKSKYGYARIDIETQDTKASNIPGDFQKVKGNYSTSLILDVSVR